MSKPITLRHRVEYALFRTAQGVVGCLSWKGALALGKGLGWLGYRLDTKHRRIMADGMRNSNLGLTEDQIRTTSKACFAHFGSILFITLKTMRMSAEALLRHTTITGLEHWDAAVAEGKGFVGFSGHYGNWEAMGLIHAIHGRHLHVIGRTLDNPLLDPYLQGVRNRFGNKMLTKAGAMRDSLKVLRQRGGVGFFLDQDALTAGVFVRFMGRWASTHPSAGLLAVKYDVPILPIFSWPDGQGILHVRIDPPFHAPQTDQPERDVWMATQMITQCIEAEIHRDPRWWFWMHRRWKTQPGQGNPLPAELPPESWVDQMLGTEAKIRG